MNFTYQWNYSDANNLWFRDNELELDQRMLNLTSIQNEHVAALEVGVAERLSFIFELPFQVNKRSLNVAPMTGGALTGRLVQETAGLADCRAYFRYWLSCDADANVAIVAGVKIPTGQDDSGNVYQDRFLYDDVSIQTGTGSWDPLLGIYAYRRMGHFTPYAAFNYRLTPAEQTGALALDPLLMNPASTIRNSIPDTLNWDVGTSFSLGNWLSERGGWCYNDNRLKGLSIFFSVHGSAIPEHDLIGDDPGFRRAYSAWFLRPGIYWNVNEDVSLFVNTPITVYRNLTEVPGSFPGMQLNAGAAYRF